MDSFDQDKEILSNPPTNATPNLTNSWSQIANEHCYPKLMAQWTSLDQPLPTYHIFQQCKPVETESNVESTYEISLNDEVDDDGDLIDVVHVTPPISLPYNQRKVTSVMYECYQHMNLVRLPLENPDKLLEKTIMESSYQQQVLIKKVLEILHNEQLARLAFTGLPEHPIKRRLSCDRAARKFRKILCDLKWDSKLTHWLHRTFLRTLDNTFLPVYLDILQVVKSRCPVLVDDMINGIESGNEAVNLLLKRPWSLMVGMSSMDLKVTFDSSPIFVTIPHTTNPLNGRRWKLWQHQISSIGKIFQVLIPDYLQKPGITHQEIVETLYHCAVTRIQELKEQFPSRPVVLISWSTGCRLSCKIAEVEKIACLINLGPTTKGIDYLWKASSDPFSDCVTPCVFVIGDRGLTCCWKYIKELRSKMRTITSLVLVHGADDLLRLSFDLKQELNVTQPILDRLIQDRIYEFLIYLLPCNFPSDIARQFRKRKSISEIDRNDSHLSCPTINNAIILTAHSPNDNGVTPLFNGLLNNNSKMITGRSSTPSTLRPFITTNNHSELPLSKLPKIGRPPKNPRPRSKSTTSSFDQKIKGNNSNNILRNRSLSGDHTVNHYTSPDSNSNCNNSNDASPNTLLAIANCQPQIPGLLPITPPQNPFENPNQISCPKIRKQLNL